MSERGRAQSESNVYHVTARGVGQQVIFENDDDRQMFGRLMRKHLANFEVELFAWCFMQNHVHFLLRCPLPVLSSFMGRLLADYARYYNWRYSRSGHLFQGRFDSKPVRDDAHFLATIRYIHQNPRDLKIFDFAAYPWSSYREYLGTSFISSVAFPLELFGGRDSFERAHLIIETNRELEPSYHRRNRFSSDDEAIARAKEVTGCAELTQIAAASKQDRDAMLVALKADGFSTRLLSRLTGISKSVVQRA